jgi:hypothetical protein
VNNPSLKSQSLWLLIAIVSSNLAITVMSTTLLDMRSATNLICGALFLTVNLLFYTLLSAAILIKKNIAWMGPVIVIKYLFLIASVYFVWAYSDVLLVLSGMFVELIIIIIIFMILQKWLARRDIENESL